MKSRFGGISRDLHKSTSVPFQQLDRLGLQVQAQTLVFKQ